MRIGLGAAEYGVDFKRFTLNENGTMLVVYEVGVTLADGGWHAVDRQERELSKDQVDAILDIAPGVDSKTRRGDLLNAIYDALAGDKSLPAGGTMVAQPAKPT